MQIIELLRSWIILLPVIENGIDGEQIQVEHHLGTSPVGNSEPY